LLKRAADAMITIMRYPEGHKQAVRQQIVDQASKALRLHGLAGVSIPALMKEVGLTHGGFYTHFKDRDELVVEAVHAAASETAKTVFSKGMTLQEALGTYLSLRHMEHPEHGCVLAALGTDGTRQSTRVQMAFSQVAREFLKLIDRKVNPQRHAATLSDQALVQAATMVGAVVLGRLVGDSALAKRILTAARKTTST